MARCAPARCLDRCCRTRPAPKGSRAIRSESLECWYSFESSHVEEAYLLMVPFSASAELVGQRKWHHTSLCALRCHAHVSTGSGVARSTYGASGCTHQAQHYAAPLPRSALACRVTGRQDRTHRKIPPWIGASAALVAFREPSNRFRCRVCSYYV